MNASMSITDNVALMESELASLRTQTASDAETIGLLKENNKQLHGDYETLKEKLERELRQMKYERDVANQKANQVLNLIKQIGSLSLEGVRAMIGDEAVTAAQIEPPQDDARLPANELATSA